MTDNTKRDDAGKPRRPAKQDAAFDRNVRLNIARMPLAERQRMAGSVMSHSDGRPLSEDEIRQYIRREHGAGTGREDIRRALVVDDQLDRRIGSLGPAEISVILAEEWPVSAVPS
jgi:hypothetical protein